MKIGSVSTTETDRNQWRRWAVRLPCRRHISGRIVELVRTSERSGLAAADGRRHLFDRAVRSPRKWRGGPGSCRSHRLYTRTAEHLAVGWKTNYWEQLVKTLAIAAPRRLRTDVRLAASNRAAKPGTPARSWGQTVFEILATRIWRSYPIAEGLEGVGAWRITIRRGAGTAIPGAASTVRRSHAPTIRRSRIRPARDVGGRFPNARLLNYLPPLPRTSLPPTLHALTLPYLASTMRDARSTNTTSQRSV